MNNIFQTLLVPIVVIVGLVVLIALHDLDANVGVPIIAGLAGVHIGANVVSPSTSTTTKTTQQGQGPVL